MSTRSTTHFVWAGETTPTAIIYRHPDGYPEGHGAFLLEFFADLEANVRDHRFDDPSYLSAKLVVALAREFNVGYEMVQGNFERVQKQHPLDFLSVGVMNEDPGDIEFRYVVKCGDPIDGGQRPKVDVYEIGWKTDDTLLGELADVLAKAEAE